MLHEEEVEVLGQESEQRPLLVPAGKLLDGGMRRAHHVERADRLGGLRLGGGPVNHETIAIGGQCHVLTDRQPGNQPLLEPGGGHKGDARFEKAAIRLVGHVVSGDGQRTGGQGQDARAGLEEEALPAALEPCQAEHLSRAHG